jgi:hypothetical protein
MYAPGDNGNSQKLWPADQFQSDKDPERTIPRIAHDGGDDENNKFEWFDAIRQGKPEVAYSNFDYGATQTEAMLLGNIAVRTGQPFSYDGATGTISGNPDAPQHLAVTPRLGWEY